MCISLLSTAHPDYPFILLSNRDEFLNRPTAPAHWWDAPHQHVLGGRDLQREERGTWLAITRDGRIAVLTNFREEGVVVSKDKSRGGIVNAYVTQSPELHEDVEGFVNRLINDVGIHDVGGFTLLLGELRAPKEGSLPGLSIVSNRTASVKGLNKIAKTLGETHGLSNSHYGDKSWPKVVHGEELLQQAIRLSHARNDDESKFVKGLFDILSVNTLPRPKHDESWEVYVRQMRNSIMIPPVGGKAVERQPRDKIASANGTSTPDQEPVNVGEGVYGTQKQTVVLVNRLGKVTFIERTLYDDDGNVVDGGGVQRAFNFDIEGWQG